MISWSLSDLQLISAFKDMSEFDMLKIENDELLQKYLYILGMDVPDFPMMFFPCIHRNLQDKIVMGYKVIGECRCDRAYKDSYMAGITERLLISAFNDTSLMKEIAELSYKVRDIEEFVNDNDSIDFDEDRALFPADQLEPDWEVNEQKLKELGDILLSIRGPQYGPSGSLKTNEEYKAWAEEREFYQEKYDC